MSQDWTEFIKALNAFFNALIGTFGPLGTLGIAFAIAALSFSWRVYIERQKDKDTDRAIKAMEEAVQRCATEAREFRVAIFKEKFGWTDEQVERFIFEAIPKTPMEARNRLEGNSKNKKRSNRSKKRR